MLRPSMKMEPWLVMLNRSKASASIRVNLANRVLQAGDLTYLNSICRTLTARRCRPFPPA